MQKLTTDKKKIAALAAKMRAMSDEELVHYLENRIRKAQRETENELKKLKAMKEYCDGLDETGGDCILTCGAIENAFKYAYARGKEEANQ